MPARARTRDSRRRPPIADRAIGLGSAPAAAMTRRGLVNSTERSDCSVKVTVPIASATDQGEPGGQATQALSRRQDDGAKHDVSTVGGASGDENDAIHSQPTVTDGPEAPLNVPSTFAVACDPHRARVRPTPRPGARGRDRSVGVNGRGAHMLYPKASWSRTAQRVRPGLARAAPHLRLAVPGGRGRPVSCCGNRAKRRLDATHRCARCANDREQRLMLAKA
jgi:hypothetical protein